MSHRVPWSTSWDNMWRRKTAAGKTPTLPHAGAPTPRVPRPHPYAALRQELKAAVERVAALQAETQELRATNETLQDKLQCRVCMAADRTVVCMPCWHFAVCATCSTNLKECPACRGKLTGKCELYVV